MLNNDEFAFLGMLPAEIRLDKCTANNKHLSCLHINSCNPLQYLMANCLINNVKYSSVFNT